jgi:hypothetical protein
MSQEKHSKYVRKIIRFLKKKFPVQALHYHIHCLLVKDPASYLVTTGWIRSMEEKRPIDPDGNPIPWMNYAVVSFLKKRLKKNMTVFEYGSGASTHFFAAWVQDITSVEYDKKWFDQLQQNQPENVALLFQQNDTDGLYCRTIQLTDKKYDLVVVDGRDRVNCIKQCMAALTPQGVILLDDSQRDKYLPGIEYAKSQGFSILEFEGMKPGGHRLEQTMLLYKPGNCLEI